MWDLIVDASANPRDEFDFTDPQTLETYLENHYKPRLNEANDRVQQWLGSGYMNRIGSEIQDTRANFEDLKAATIPNAPVVVLPARLPPGLIYMDNDGNMWTGWVSDRQPAQEGARMEDVRFDNSPTMFYRPGGDPEEIAPGVGYDVGYNPEPRERRGPGDI